VKEALDRFRSDSYVSEQFYKVYDFACLTSKSNRG
jgi:hypothetical protein